MCFIPGVNELKINYTYHAPKAATVRGQAVDIPHTVASCITDSRQQPHRQAPIALQTVAGSLTDRRL